MTSTSVHFPEDLLQRLDRLAVARGTSRNRLIVEACATFLEAERGEWPRGFFDSPIAPDDLALLREAGRELESAILGARRDHAVPEP
jgi:hypothetical protein